MERLGILPNSMVTGQTESIINQKKLQVERERKDKDRAMLSKVREMIERRRAGEGSRGGTRGGTVSRGATLLESAMMSSVDLTAEKMEVLETEHPDRPVTPHEIQVQDEMQHTTETEEHKRKKTPAKPHSPAKGKREKTPDTRKEPEPLPETQKLKAKKKKVHAATIVARLRVIDPGTGVATVDYSGLGAIRLESISPTSRVRTTQPVQIGVRGVEEPEHAYTPAQPPPPPKPTIDTKPKPFPTTDKPADKLPPLPPLPPAGPLHRGKHNKRRESNAYRPEEIVEEMPTSGGDDSTRFPSAATHISTSRVFTQPDMHQISQSRMSMRSAIRAQSTFSNRFIEEELQVEDIVPELQGIMDAFWFPGMKGQKLTLENIIATLFHVLKTGYWSEKAEASDALLQLYHDFSDEFRDPTMNFVLPQIESLNDRDWQTRVRLCQNLVKYGVSHPMLIHGLIARLLDPHEAVRAAAAKSLAVFEIDTRSSLRNMLQRLHMLPNAALGPQMDWLDVLILRQRDRQAAMEAQSQRNASHWLTTANPICDGRAFTRPPSSFVTLVPPELEGEKFVMPTFTAADNAAAAAAKAAHHRKAKGKPPKVQREVMVEDR
ncbi:uncharacterized protein EV422DRAFT_210912 [Fimicolochytrium jonesii]|uniref:uncharacterized protein n=1 Tax=Fimicolochytrium jonesii TaxID=1396493 RepID=UPI0022FDBF79|nr:uncharacterized protein EV422DRAFT_210912 [Fimicolochytrium jonesii]KAI8817660.1 hypothetical protein EV422DRAFT_210912 [Fimicolochytrium jonesii]